MTGAFGMVETHLRGKRILLVDDERELADMVATILHGAGFASVDIANSSAEALSSIAARSASPEHAYQLFVLDVMMPGMDGFELLGRIRQLPAHTSTPALFLTAKDEPFDRVSGLTLGADDYIAKPFLPQELVLRIAAVLRRCYAAENPLLELAASRVNFATAEVERADGQTVPLTAKEHEILSVLARNAGRTVTIDSLCEACWGTSFGYENSLMAHIRRLREKIEADPSAPVSLVTRADWATSWSSAASSWAAPLAHLLETVAQGDRRASRASSPSSCCCSWRWRCSSWSSTSSCTPSSPTGNRTRTSTTARPASTTRAVDQALEQDADGSWTLGENGLEALSQQDAWALVIGTDARWPGRRTSRRTCPTGSA